MNAEYFDMGDSTYFFSYDTLVCVVEDNRPYIKITLLQNWRYSASTTRQVMRFINENYPWLRLSARELVRDLSANGCMVYSADNYPTVQIVSDNQPCGKLNAYHKPGTPLRFCI